MLRKRLGVLVLWSVLFGFFVPYSEYGAAQDDSNTLAWRGTRIEDADQHKRQGDEKYPFRKKEELILREMDLRPRDVVLDIGAGDGWWSERIAPLVGKQGKVYASEIEEDLVEEMKKDYADVPQIQPYLCATDSTNLEEDTCDLVFMSQVYHHIEEDGKVAYLRHLHDVVKPHGRLMIIERYVEVVTKSEGHGTRLAQLIAQAEKADWVLLRYELMPGTYHYLTVFAQAERFPPESED